MGQLTTDPPDILDRNRFQPVIRVIALAEVERPGTVRGLFGQAIGQLGLSFAGPQADGDWDAEVLSGPCPQLPGPTL